MNATWIAFLLYSLAAVALGLKSYRRGTAGSDYWTAGRSLSGASVGLSISAGFMSVSWSCVYAVQLFYWYGLGAIWLITIPWLVTLIIIYFLAARYRALPAFSQPEMVGQRFGPTARKSVAVALAVVFLVWGGAELYVAGLLLAPQLGVSPPVMIIIIGLIVAIYATLGGFGAVVATDKLQYLLVALYILPMGYLAAQGLSETTGGWPDIEVHAAKSGSSWTSLSSPGIAVIFLTFVAYLPGWVFETDLWLRVQAADTPASARKGIVMAIGSALLFVGILPLFIGIGSLALYPLEAGSFPGAVGMEGEAIFAALVSSYAPPYLVALVAVGLVAAAMSTIDTCVNVMALSIGYDLAGEAPGDTNSNRPRIITLLSVGAATLFALYTQSLWDIFYLSSGILTAAVAAPVAAVFWPRANPRGITASSIAGFAGVVLAYFLETYGGLGRWEPLWLAESGLGFIIWGIMAALAGYWAGSRLPGQPATSR